MGFAGNVEPCFIVPTVVAVNESFLGQSRGQSKGNWAAQHSAGVMADLDFFIGEEAVSRSQTSSMYTLSYPIRHGQVHISLLGLYFSDLCVRQCLFEKAFDSSILQLKSSYLLCLANHACVFLGGASAKL